MKKEIANLETVNINIFKYYLVNKRNIVSIKIY